jgi:hypothetical protein
MRKVINEDVDEVLHVPQSPFVYIEEGVCVKSLSMDGTRWVVHTVPYQSWTTSAETYSDLRLAMQAFKRRDPSIWWLRLSEDTIKDIMRAYIDAQLTILIADAVDRGSESIWNARDFKGFSSLSVVSETVISVHNFNLPTNSNWSGELRLIDPLPYIRANGSSKDMVLTRRQIDGYHGLVDNVHPVIPMEFTHWSIRKGETHGTYWLAKPVAGCYSINDVQYIHLSQPVPKRLVGSWVNSMAQTRRISSNIWSEVIKIIDKTNKHYVAPKPRKRRKKEIK